MKMLLAWTCGNVSCTYWPIAVAPARFRGDERFGDSMSVSKRCLAIETSFGGNAFNAVSNAWVARGFITITPAKAELFEVSVVSTHYHIGGPTDLC